MSRPTVDAHVEKKRERSRLNMAACYMCIINKVFAGTRSWKSVMVGGFRCIMTGSAAAAR